MLELLGEGGMGEVWLAEQQKPVHRHVALKIIKPGMDSKRVIARFEAERQALALMDHPHVAKVFDGGTTRHGRPFFVMEYVKGIPINEHCDRQKLGNRERLELFIKVCEGVQHAHQKAIIHRDLKPTNVLVADQDGQSVPKIIDFGVAKAITGRLTDKTLHTEFGALVGTPEYMSPEQAAIGDNVDTRADVYSLGVILYELLVGSLPFASKELTAEGIRARLLSDDPPTPSRRLSTMGGDATSRSASQHGTDPERLRREIRGDLDWITMRALERERTRRYGSPVELAADIRRHLLDQPVEAGPPSLTYRVGKFVRRHRAGVVIASVGLLLLLGGLAATTLLWTEARLERRRADANYEQVLRLADLKRLRDYRAEADRLWPAVPTQIDAMTAWLAEKGEPLAASLAGHRAVLKALRAGAQPYGEEERLYDREHHPLAAEWDDLVTYIAERKERIERVRENEQLEDRAEILAHYQVRVATAEARLAELRPLVAGRWSWHFDNDETQWQHDMLTDLVARLERFNDPDPFVGGVARVRERLEFSRTIAERSIDGAAVRKSWDEAIASIRSEPAYGGVEIEPQLGLVPLRKHPASGLWEFWHIESGARPGETIIGADGMTFVLLPGGTYVMGAQSTDPAGLNYDAQAERRERPPIELTLTPFFLSKYETTQAQWERLVGSNPSRHAPGDDIAGQIITRTNPVEQVSWRAATRVLEQRGLRLPTEAQWEYAARGGTTNTWWTGNNPRSLAGAANLRDNHMKNNGGRPQRVYVEWLNDGYSVHAPVGTLRPNSYRLHNLVGNVSEWVMDSYRAPYRTEVRAGDGYRELAGGSPTRVSRGGSFRSITHEARATRRTNLPPESFHDDVGVRPARPIDP